MAKLPVVRALAGICALAAFAPAAGAADEPDVKADDESLSCDAIYAEGLKIVQSEQQQRDAVRNRMDAEAKGTAALVATAMTVGQADPTHATGIAAKAALEGMVKSQVDLGTQASAARPDARKERLRTLWTQKHCTKN